MTVASASSTAAHIKQARQQQRAVQGTFYSTLTHMYLLLHIGKPIMKQPNIFYHLKSGRQFRKTAYTKNIQLALLWPTYYTLVSQVGPIKAAACISQMNAISLSTLSYISWSGPSQSKLK